jgi:hypothetical protein
MKTTARIELREAEPGPDRRVKLFREQARIRGSELVRKEAHQFVLGHSGFERAWSEGEPPAKG